MKKDTNPQKIDIRSKEYESIVSGTPPFTLRYGILLIGASLVFIISLLFVIRVPIQLNIPIFVDKYGVVNIQDSSTLLYYINKGQLYLLDNKRIAIIGKSRSQNLNGTINIKRENGTSAANYNFIISLDSLAKRKVKEFDNGLNGIGYVQGLKKESIIAMLFP